MTRFALAVPAAVLVLATAVPGRGSSPATKPATPSWSTRRSTLARPISSLPLDTVRWGARTGSGPAPRSGPRAAARCGQPGAAGPALDNRRWSDRPVRPADPGPGLDDRGGVWLRGTGRGRPPPARRRRAGHRRTEVRRQRRYARIRK